MNNSSDNSIHALRRPVAVIMLTLAAFFAPYFAHANVEDAIAADEAPLLKVEEAFKLEVTSIAPDMLRARWVIADGYFLYRDKFRFATEQAGLELGPAIFPPGKIKQDEFFGEVETYRHEVTADIPVVFSGPAAAQWQIQATYQGCADRGVCYPPHKQTISFAAPVTAAPTSEPPAADGQGGLLGALGGLSSKLGFGKQRQEFLPPDEAFQPIVEAVDGTTLVARWDIAEGYYLYRDKFGFALQGDTTAQLGTVQSPPGEFKEDETFGRMEVYHNRVELRIPIARTDASTASNINVEAKYQGCAEKGFCYPPMTKVFTLALPAASAAGTTPSATPTTAVMPTTPAAGQAPRFVSEQDQLVQTLTGGSRLGTIALFFGLGLLLAFTPCVFPMIPILSSIIVGRGEGTTTKNAFMLSLFYVMPMALTYTVVGVIAGLTGANLQAAFQNPAVIISFSIVFVLLALSMFGFYNLQIPAALQTKLSTLSNRQQGGTYIGAAIMGLLSALIVGPCVAAPLAAALIYISQTGDAVLGGIALFSLSMGMGAPLMVIGTSAGKLLPRVGGWMNTIKAVFGVMLLALAIWMLERIAPPVLTMLLWAILAIVVAIYLGALHRLEKEADGWQKLWQGVGVILLLYGALLLVGVASGGKDVLRPLEKLAMAATAPTGQANAAIAHGVTFKRVKGIDGLNAAIAEAKANGKTVMLDFYADWCISCKELERYTFSDAVVQRTLANTELLQTDVTANDDADQALLKHFGLFGPPAILFFNAAGTEQRDFRIIGFMKPEQFAAQAQLALAS